MEEFLKKLIEFNIRLAKRLATEDMKLFEEITELEKQYHSKWAVKPEVKTDPIYDNLPKEGPKSDPVLREKKMEPTPEPEPEPEEMELPEKPNVDFEF